MRSMNSVMNFLYFTVQGEVMKNNKEENLGILVSSLTQPDSDCTGQSPESYWGEDQEVIPTFFSVMNTR